MICFQFGVKVEGAAFCVLFFPAAEMGCLRPDPQLWAAWSPWHRRVVAPQLEGRYASFRHVVPPLQWAK